MADSKTVLDGAAIEAVAKLADRAAQVQKLSYSVEGTEFDREFTDRQLYRVPADPDMPAPVSFLTLTGFADYLVADEAAKDLLVRVASPTKVDAMSRLEGAHKHLRRLVATAEFPSADLHGFQFNRYTDLETFAIALQTCFAPDLGEIDDLRKFSQSVRKTREIGIADDGVSQQVQARAGVAAVTDVAVKNPWELAPWRTFMEIAQPVSPYILRFSRGADDEPPMAGLFETGNAQWKLHAVEGIARWLRVKLTGWPVLG